MKGVREETKPLGRWLAGVRQIVETVFDKLDTVFRLEWERPHALDGFQARLRAMSGAAQLLLLAQSTPGPLFIGFC